MLLYIIIAIVVLVYLDAFSEMLSYRKRLKKLEAMLSGGDKEMAVLLQIEKENRINMWWWLWGVASIILLMVLIMWLIQQSRNP